jgi:hypothetical protein
MGEIIMNIAKLDKVFSEYIRLRDSDENGYCHCISCGKIAHWKDMDCGHFINRKHMSLRFNDVNCNAQCRLDNRFDEGNLEGYRRGLIIKHGPDIIDRLYAMKNVQMKFSQIEIDLLTKEYAKKVTELKKLKKWI